jgi:hypothetical protein
VIELENLFGLPAHPLIVHAAVVLLPLAALLTLVAAVLPRARRVWAPVALGLAILATAAVGLAQGSGESLEERVDRTALVEAHTGQAERVLPWAAGLTVVSALVVAAGPLQRRVPKLDARAITATLVVVVLLVGGAATWTLAEVGHSGAKATWAEVGSGEDHD